MNINLLGRNRRWSDDSIDVPCDLPSEEYISSGGGDGVDGEDRSPVEQDAEPYTAPNNATSLAMMAQQRREEAATYRLMAAQRCGFMLSSRRSDLFIRRLNKLMHPRPNPFGCAPTTTAGGGGASARLQRKRTQSLSQLFSWPDEGGSLAATTGCLRLHSSRDTSANAIYDSLPHKSATLQLHQHTKVVPAEEDTVRFILSVVQDMGANCTASQFLTCQGFHPRLG